jgi:hypothetical protein
LEDLSSQELEEEAEDLLVQGYLGFMRRIGDLLFFLATLGDDELLWCFGCTGEEVLKSCASHDGKHLRLLEQMVVLRWFLRDGMAEQQICGAGCHG